MFIFCYGVGRFVVGCDGLFWDGFNKIFNNLFPFLVRRMVGGKAWVSFGVFLGVAGIAVPISASDASIFPKASNAFSDFGNYQMLTADEMTPDEWTEFVEKKLRVVPDGVYILVIGESLNREHMNVYGYPRENTPFQSQAAKDEHYTFFDRAYASYTQTIPALLFSLTEKNQYDTSRRYGTATLIDMARAAGFTTTWISNQSREGKWDTPIGEIGETSDVQYWVNEYVGDEVVAKDCDDVLISYLAKVDPDNRRQLIVVHLMGSHIPYWDRYPSEFYRYPYDRGATRSDEQILVDEYDNSVYYNDYVMHGIMDTAIHYLHADGVLYFSDHGDEIFKKEETDEEKFHYDRVRIPLWVYTSDRYREIFSDTYGRMKEREHTVFTNDMIYDTLLGLMGIRASHYDATCDLFGNYDKSLKVLRTMRGRVPIEPDCTEEEERREALRKLTFPEDAMPPKDGYPMESAWRESADEKSNETVS